MIRKHLISIVLSLSLAACGARDDAPAADAGTSTDLSRPVDASGEDAATDDASVDDASTPADAGESPDMCAPLCPKPAPGCVTEPSSNPCVCPTIRCDDAGMGAKQGDPCGGRAGPCADGLFCNLTADFDCGFADGMGICELRPGTCSRILMPVCGCDGNDYSNPCEAQRGGTDVQLDGMCPPRD